MTNLSTDSTSQQAVKWLIHEPAKTTVTRIFPELAVEIGLNESIILMQISFWLSTCENAESGKYWTFQTLRGMKDKAFPYWGVETIRRTLIRLEKQGYIFIGNFNKRKGDKTQWFALNPDKLSELKSVVVLPVEDVKIVSKRDSVSQNETATHQNETTLPETTTETTTDKKRQSRKIEETDEVVFRREWTAYADYGCALLKQFGIDCAFQKPSETPRAALESYLDTAKQLKPAGATLDEIPALYRYVAQRAKRENWSGFGVKTLVKYFLDYRASAKKIMPLDPEQDLSKPVEFVPILQKYAGEAS